MEIICKYTDKKNNIRTWLNCHWNSIIINAQPILFLSPRTYSSLSRLLCCKCQILRISSVHISVYRWNILKNITFFKINNHISFSHLKMNRNPWYYQTSLLIQGLILPPFTLSCFLVNKIIFHVEFLTV